MSDPGREAPRPPSRAGLVIAGGLAALGAVLIYDAARLPVASGYSGMGPADAPRLVGLALIALAVWTVVSAFREVEETPPAQEVGPVVWILGGLAAQLLLLGFAGFSIATGILFACTARAFGKRQLHYSLPAGIVFALVVYGVFAILLKLSLPAGPLEALAFGWAR